MYLRNGSRPKTNGVWTNRYLNIRNYDLMVNHGWGYAKNKHLDLLKDEGYGVLGVLP